MEFFGTVIWAIVQWSFILTWRFLSGAHMTGKTYNDSTWWKRASNEKRRAVARRNNYTWWKAKSRMGRVAWRNSIFWTFLGLLLAFTWDWSSTLIILGFTLPGLWLLTEKYHHGWHRVRCVFQQPFVGQHSDGSVHQHWVWKTSYRHFGNKFRQRQEKRWRAGVATVGELQGAPKIVDVPVDMERAVRAELAEDMTSVVPIELKLLLDPDTDFV